MSSGFGFHPAASKDLDEIRECIASDNSEAATRFIDEIIDTIAALVPMPHVGHCRPDLTGRPLRFIRIRDYLIAYAPEKKPLWVIAVLHGRRDPRVLAAILRSRES